MLSNPEKIKIHQEIAYLLIKLEDKACECDIMYGFGCDAHDLIRKLSKEIAKLTRETE